MASTCYAEATLIDMRQRKRIWVRGIVQGVGFRPFLYSLATRYTLTGFVSNQSDGVALEVQGAPNSVAAFLRDLHHGPPLAVIDEIQTEDIAPLDETGFHIIESSAQANRSTPISPDIAICDDCLRELFDPADRRFRYPFINCTNCGPRFTIIRDIPYDRHNTTMAAFRMCPACDAEYHSPENRRFHAQPNACPRCGPKVWFERADEPIRAEEEAISTARAALARGEIVAIKGIGGFHLAADARNEDAVSRLRERKGRRDKPFALMARDIDIIARYARINDQERQILLSRQRPIVLLSRTSSETLAPSVAPGNPLIGFMLPYAPLHYLLLDEHPLVMTSGNLSEEPIVWRNNDARERLGKIADAFLLHDRDIHVPCDDSVVTVFQNHELPIRRSRGYSPMPVKLPVTCPATLAVGAELKACFCLTRDHYAYMSQHIGDMENLETIEAFERANTHMQALFRCKPERVACDAHPGYLSSRWARTYGQEHNLPVIQVQHHHAHALAIMAEHGLPEDASVLAFAFDGTGYGTDGAIWGGEILLARYDKFERLAHLKYVPLPGGDAAIRRPARAALAHLFAAGIEWSEDFPCVQASSAAELRVLRQQLQTGTHSVPTSSMGRFFDAVAAFIGIRQNVSYEGQAAIELEALCSRDPVPAYPMAYTDNEFDTAPLWHALIEDQRAHVSLSLMAARFHRTIAEVILHYSQLHDCQTVALTGGVFQNIFLLQLACELLANSGFRVLTHRTVPPNDGGIALGQAAIAR